MPGLLAHRPLERRERAVGDAVDRREVGARDAHRGQRRRLGEELLPLRERHHAIHGLVEATVHGNQIARHLHSFCVSSKLLHQTGSQPLPEITSCRSATPSNDRTNRRLTGVRSSFIAVNAT